MRIFLIFSHRPKLFNKKEASAQKKTAFKKAAKIKNEKLSLALGV